MFLGELHPYYYFITDWPTKAKAFYIKPKDDNPELSEGFDLMWHWMELSSGGARIHDKELLMKRLEEQGPQHGILQKPPTKLRLRHAPSRWMGTGTG